MKITIAVADDQQLFLKSLCTLIDTFESFKTVTDAVNGDDLLKKLERLKKLPDILVIDVNMPVMDGPAAAQLIAKKYPSIKMVALSMKDDDNSVIGMLRAGCCSYLLKDIHPDELEKALLEISEKGFYNADAYNINYRRLIKLANQGVGLVLTEKEKLFLRLSCSDLTYRQIATMMGVAERTVDGYRESLFHKLKVQSRVGMVLEGLRQNLVTLDGLHEPVKR